MKTVTIGDFKRRLSDLLEEVAKGEKIVLQKGRRRANVAILSPFTQDSETPRQLGVFADRGKPVFRDWEITEEEFLGNE